MLLDRISGWGTPFAKALLAARATATATSAALHMQLLQVLATTALTAK